MPELIRSVVSRVRLYVHDRRQSPRLRVRLLFTVSIRRATKDNGLTRRKKVLHGHTKDLSRSGLALLVPQAHLDGHHLAAAGGDLEVNLELPGGPISMIVGARRYEQLEKSELGCTYLIGARILHVDDDDLARYLSFISAEFAKK
jgi:PilZ domain-containing protein